MNIQIGNDVRVELPLSALGNVDPANIKFARCIFIAKTQETENSNCHIFNCSQQYTIHNCNDLSYNVLPHNCCQGHCHADPHNCGFVVNGLFDYISICRIESNNLIAYFPGEKQKILGDYDCKFEVKVSLANWDFDNIRMYTVYRENEFTLNNVFSNKNDTFILSATESELIACNGDYSSLMRNEFRVNVAVGKETKCIVDVIGATKKIVVFSKYDNLVLRFGSFDVSFNVYLTTNGYYMYVTQETYSDLKMDWYVSFADKQNDPILEDPYFNQDQPIKCINYLDNDTIVFCGVYENEQLNNFGQIKELTTIVL